MRISSRSAVTVGASVNQSSGRRPANQPEIVLVFVMRRLHHYKIPASRPQRGTEAGGVVLGFVVARVLRPRPEEAAEAVALRARHDMHMQVWHGLAHDVVLGDPRP